MFAKRVDETASEHANEASATREMTVTSSSERSEEREDETVIDRTIKNVNMRRVLNFVFRELNQEYIVKMHLKDVRVAFTNGRLDTWREVPLSGLRGLLEEFIKTGKIDEVAQQILHLVALIFDRNDTPVASIEQITMAANGQNWAVTPAVPNDDGVYPPPSNKSFYRFKRGALAQNGEQHQVDGVLMKERRIIMRTDSVIVEALLGQSDALDQYAMEVQEAAATSKTLANTRERLAHTILRGIVDPKEKVESYAAMFRNKTAEQ